MIRSCAIWLTLQISACSHIAFSGDSATTDQLRKDLTELVQNRLNERLGQVCPIQSIHTEVIDYIPNAQTRQIERMLELWLVQGCDRVIPIYVGVARDKTHGGLNLYAKYR